MKLQLGQFITLSDPRTLLDVLERDGTAKDLTGINLKVTEINRIREESGICTWTMYLLKCIDFDYDCFVTVVEVRDCEPEVFIFEVPEWYDECSRKEAIASGYPLFDGEEMAEHLSLTVDDEPVEYMRVMPTVYGVNQDSEYTGVTTYTTDRDVANKHVMLIETGGLNIQGDYTQEGPWIQLFEGRMINQDVDLSIL